MSNVAPDITFRDATNPASVVSLLQYVQSTLGSDFLPILQGEQSSVVKFRIYNNYAGNVNIASAFNVNITVYDGSGAGSRTALKSPVFQSWLRVYETGFGENSTPPGLYTAWAGSDTAIGSGPAGLNLYYPEVGSDGLLSNQVRAGSGYSQVGFIELASYLQLPPSVASASWNFSLSVSYEWVE